MVAGFGSAVSQKKNVEWDAWNQIQPIQKNPPKQNSSSSKLIETVGCQKCPIFFSHFQKNKKTTSRLTCWLNLKNEQIPHPPRILSKVQAKLLSH